MNLFEFLSKNSILKKNLGTGAVSSNFILFYFNFLQFFLIFNKFCYEVAPKEKTISCAFINLMENIQEYNAGKL